MATAAPASGMAVVSPLMTAGPAALPLSDISRQPPRNCTLASAGDASAPRVMTRQEPMPLPIPRTTATAVRAAKVWVSGRRNIPTPRTSMLGTATHIRPKRSMTPPAG